MKLPEILIVVGYRNLSAYLVLPDGLPEIVEQTDYEHDGQTSAPVVCWQDGRDGYQDIAHRISALLSRYPHQTWGLACPSTMACMVTPLLPQDEQASLGVLRKMEVGSIDVSNVAKVFDAAACDYHAEKEHC